MNRTVTSKVNKKDDKTGNKFRRLMHLIFVHNIGYKLLALGTASLCWFITVWLS